MENITVNFTFDLPDDQYYTTRTMGKTGTLTYTGPAVKWIKMNDDTDTPTGECVGEAEAEDFNNEDDGFYCVRVDCSENPLLCAIMDSATQVTGNIEISEEIPNSAPYVRHHPSFPDHVYEKRKIKYDRQREEWVTPFPWKEPQESWEEIIRFRNVMLANYDRRLSDDLPEDLYNTVAEYKQYLRDLTVSFGVQWDIIIANGGSGYSIGDRLQLSDSVYKNNDSVDDILITVTEVDDSGAITGIKRTVSKYAYEYHPAAGTYANVYYTSDSSGTGAQITLSKIKTVDCWKITLKEPPLK